MNTTPPPPTPAARGGKYDPDKLSRIIMLIYGRMDHGGPFWCYAAIKPSKFEAFKKAEEAGAIDLYKFDEFGRSSSPPRARRRRRTSPRKVAEMYGADPATFSRPIDPMVEIGKKIDEIKAADEQK
ncbi:MAG: hypothetical protein WDN72_08990 [Alphaproteobacteria bacterium]